MDSERKTPRFARLPAGLLGALALIAVVEGQVARFEGLFIEKSPACWHTSLQKTGEEGRNAEILCLGSSLTKFAVHPALIERKTGRSTYSLSIYGGRAASSYFLLERVLANGGRPAAVVLDFYEGPVPDVAPTGPSHDIRRLQRFWEELLTARDCLDLSWQARDADFFLGTCLGIALPTVRGRMEIRHEVLDAVAGRPGESRIGLQTLKRNWDVNLGSQVMPVTMHDFPPAGTQRTTGLPRDDWRNHRLLEVYTRRILELTKAHDIQVFWLLPPLTEPLLRAQHSTGFTDKYVRFACKCLADYPNLVLVDARGSGYSESLFHDPTHLNETGMVVFSDDLGEILKRRLDMPYPYPEWCVMPPYRRRSGEPVLEDLDQSRIVLDHTPSARY